MEMVTSIDPKVARDLHTSLGKSNEHVGSLEEKLEVIITKDMFAGKADVDKENGGPLQAELEVIITMAGVDKQPWLHSKRTERIIEFSIPKGLNFKGESKANKRTHENIEWDNPTPVGNDTISHLIIMLLELVSSYGMIETIAKGTPKISAMIITRDKLVAGAGPVATMFTNSPFQFPPP